MSIVSLLVETIFKLVDQSGKIIKTNLMSTSDGKSSSPPLFMVLLSALSVNRGKLKPENINFFQLRFPFNIILYEFQVYSIVVRQLYALQSVPPIQVCVYRKKLTMVSGIHLVSQDVFPTVAGDYRTTSCNLSVRSTGFCPCSVHL